LPRKDPALVTVRAIAEIPIDTIEAMLRTVPPSHPNPTSGLSVPVRRHTTNCIDAATAVNAALMKCNFKRTTLSSPNRKKNAIAAIAAILKG